MEERRARITVNREKLARVFGKIAEWSIYIMILMLPISKSIIEITIVMALVSITLARLAARKPFKRLSGAEISIIIFAALVIPSIVNSCNYFLSIKALFSKTFKFALFTLAVREILDTKEKIKNFVVIALLSAIVIIIDGFAQYFITHRDLLHFDGIKYLGYPSFQFSLPGPDYPRGFLGFPTASFPFPNDFATWIITFLPPAMILSARPNRFLWKRIMLFLVVVSLVVLLVLTKTRSAWLGFAASLCMLPIFRFIRIKKFVILLLIICILGGAIVLFGSLTPHIVAIAGIADRNVMWANAWKIFKDHPVVGSGLNTFFVCYKDVRQDEFAGKRGSYAHNCYLQMAAETGILGLAAFLVMVIMVLWRGFKSYFILNDGFLKSCLAGVILGVVAYLVQSFFDTNLYSLNLAALFWLAVGILLSVTRLAREARA